MRDAVDIHKDLIERSKKGERMAQKALFDLYSKAIFNIGIRLLGNREDAADLTQDTFIEAFTKLDQFSYKATFGAWIKRIMVNRSVNFLQRNRIFSDLETDLIEFDDEDYSENIDQLMIQLNSSLQDLPEGCRVIFTLYYF
jgi:RNA polymerase sigma-70 factor (ECF subfamily)